MTPARRVLLLGWDAADWKVIRPLLDAGAMPHLAGLMARGVHGNHATLDPPLSPTLWTSIATGKRPPKHGVLGFTEPSRDGTSVRPVSVLSRRTKALWNILAQEGKRSIVVGWWPSHPAEPIPGAVVSNHFQKVPSDPGAELPPLAPGVVWPPRIAAVVADLRVRPTEIPLEVLRLFVPRAAGIDQTRDKSLHDLAKIVAETLSVHAAATDLLEREPWDFAGVYFDAIDHASHRFMHFHPPRQRRVSEADFELYKDVVSNVYRHHDAMLGRYLELAGPDAHVLVVSDHGFHSDERRPHRIPAEPAGPAVEHRHFGVVVMAGPGIRTGERIHGSSVLDVTPTVLTLFGLPVGDDMDGQPQVQAFEQPPPVRRIPSWDDVPGADGRHPPETGHDPVAAAAQIEQLVALGYVAPLAEDRAKAVRETVRELDSNLARALVDAGKAHEAIPILERLWEEWPDEHRFGLCLLGCLARAGRTADRRRALETLRERAARFSAEARERLAALPAVEEASDDPVAARCPDQRRRQYERRRLVGLAAGLALDHAEIDQAIMEKDRAGAVAALRRTLAGIGVAGEVGFARAAFAASRLVQLGGHDEALPIVQRLLEIDSEHPGLHSLLAEIHLRRRDWGRVVDSAAESLGLVYSNPRLHATLGIALARLGRRREAVDELLVSSRQDPSQPRVLAALERLHAHDPLRALEYRRAAAELRRRFHRMRLERAAPAPETAEYDFSARCTTPPEAFRGDPSEEIVVVSGLPRSGTSMLMRVLAAGGVPTLSDDVRRADDNNRLGYHEYEPVKTLAAGGRDHAWLEAARGKGLKVVVPLLGHLPPSMPASILAIHRPLRQVLASQEAMKERLGTTARGASPATLARRFAADMERIDSLVASRPGWRVLHVAYERMLADPEGECRRIAAFLGRRFDAAAGARGIDASQRRF